MEITELDELLRRLAETNGVGYSGRIRETIVEELRKLDIDGEITRDGSVYAFLKGAREKNVLITAHLDEIGFIVDYIEDNGFIRFKEIGGTDVRILPGQEVIIMGKRDIKGYIGVMPPHLLSKEEREKVLPVDKLFIDTGLKKRELKRFVNIGDLIAFAGKYLRLKNDFRSGKGLDNRASIACSIMAIGELKKAGAPCNVHFLGASQEEFTGLGAKIHSYRLPIDYAIVIDVTHGEHPELKEEECYQLNKGPVITRGPTIPKKLFKMLVETAKESEIPYQIEPAPIRTYTDAEAIAFNKEGIPTCVLGIPLRYMHTPVEVVCLKDIELTARLIINFIKKFGD
uniref:M42 family peptidase n=1 Tax=candidate division WOR-3 bacterium TaxID=2052148 RepID=A0A7C4XFC9_UNCW3